MATTSNGFDLSQMIDELSKFVRDRISSIGTSGSGAKPDSVRIEIAVLSSLEASAKNEQQILEALKISSAGVWHPTAGQIHQMLADLISAGKVSSSNKKDRKIFSITSEGQNWLKDAVTHLEKHSVEANSGDEKAAGFSGCDVSFLKAASRLTPAIMDIAQTASREQQKKAAEVLEATRHQLHVILAEK